MKATNNIPYCINDNQYFDATTEGSQLKSSFRMFLHSLIRENATHNGDTYSLFVDDLEDIDLKLFLSHILTANDYADFCATEVRLHAAINDYKHEMQTHINEQLSVVFAEDMEEMGIYLNQYHNGDRYWEKR